MSNKNGNPRPPLPLSRFWDSVEKTPTCWLWRTAINDDGYGMFNARGLNGRGHGPLTAHRVAWIMENGETNGLLVLHTCDVPSCVRPDHLFLGTNQDNSDDMVRKGRSLRGERNHKARLTAADVRSIRRRRKRGETLVALGEAFGVSHAMIGYIVRGTAWRHV